MENEFIFTTANVVFTIGTLKLFKMVFKNRNSLKDYDLVGSGLTTIALLLMIGGYMSNQMFVSFVFLMPTFLFWLYVSIFAYINRKHEANIKVI